MQPWFERVAVPPDRSWLLFDRRLPAFPFNWHYHPEFELTLTLGSRGMRFVGDHAERYDDGDLALLGPDLPHAWESEATLEPGGEHRAIVCWFTRPWIDGMIALMPELARLRPMLEAAGRGLTFGPETRATARQGLTALVDLPAERQPLGLLGVLLDLAGDDQRRSLAAGEMALGEASRDRARMARLLAWLHAHYTEPLRLAPLTEIAHLSESQLQRMFRRSARMSLSAYVTQLRIGQACRLLIQTDRSVGAIAAETGFSDAAHFARHFRAAKGVTASRYRAAFRAQRA
ncbi:MAG: AraC family transcriptional regulator [Amaricoccus sp.]